MIRRKPAMSNPIFEIITPEQHIRIYANGVVEGCGKEGRIVNHIGTAIRPELFAYFSKSHEPEPCNVPYVNPNPTILGSSGSGTSQGIGENGARISAQEVAATGEK